MYIYLGMLLHYNGKFTYTQKRASQQGSRALASLTNSLQNLYINTNRKCFSFDTMISTVLNYASEIWGFHRARDVELVHNRFCRYALNLGKSTPTSFLYGELGHLPMYIVRKFKIIKYWLHLLQNQPKIVYDVYQLLLNDANMGKRNWASDIRDMFFELGLNYMWLNQNDIYVSYDFIKSRILDQYYQTWRTSIAECEKLKLYMSYKLIFDFESYLNFDFDTTLLCKLRSGTLKLQLEVGRYEGVLRNNRLCKCCNMNIVEYEYHFILVCPEFRVLRCQFLPRYYCSWPNIHKLKVLISAKSVKLSRQLCLYLKSAWKHRSQLL